MNYDFVVNAGPIKSISALVKALGVSQAELDQVLNLQVDARYSQLDSLKADGSLREVYRPSQSIRKIQRRINNRIFNPPKSNTSLITWPSYIYGCIPNQRNGGVLISKDYVACANTHSSAKSILKMDIKDFFSNVHDDIVGEVFRDLFNYTDVVTDALVNITTRNGCLPQGALTSSYLATLAMFKDEPKLVRKLRKKQLVYTRLVDDITISSKNENYNFGLVQRQVEDLLMSHNLPVNTDKTEVKYIGTEPLMVHGLRVNYQQARLPEKELSSIRSHVHSLERLAKEPNYIQSHSYRKDFNRCMGRVNKLKRVGHNQHKKLVDRLKRILPLPSKSDLARCNTMVSKLQRDYQLNSDTYWYYKRYYRIRERLVILKRSYETEANNHFCALRGLKPRWAP